MLSRAAQVVAVHAVCLLPSLALGAWLIFEQQTPQCLDLPLAIVLALLGHEVARGLLRKWGIE